MGFAKVVAVLSFSLFGVSEEGPMASLKVQIVNYESQANHKVCFVNYESQQKNHQLLMGGKLVTSSPDIKVFIVKYESQANILIMQKNFPK